MCKIREQLIEVLIHLELDAVEARAALVESRGNRIAGILRPKPHSAISAALSAGVVFVI